MSYQEENFNERNHRYYCCDGNEDDGDNDQLFDVFDSIMSHFSCEEREDGSDDDERSEEFSSNDRLVVELFAKHIINHSFVFNLLNITVQ